MSNDLSDLKHIKKKISSGGEIYVLDNGAVINSESEAMLQALHSRSVGGLKDHLEVLQQKGASNFMSNFYVGYGHKSIGDCGSTTIFIEGVSMLAAKAIQDFKLYNGQESSTRYIDFSKQFFINPLRNNEGGKILESEREFYLSVLGSIKEYLREQHLKPDNEKDNVYEKAINARAFDIARGFLPAGASTNLSWHSNLRQVADRLVFLRNHLLEEVRSIAFTLEDAVNEAHPNSFSRKRYFETEKYQALIAQNYFYHDLKSPEMEVTSNINLSSLEDSIELFEQRPAKTELPKFLSHLGTISARFKLDFGSFRDIQRHRAIDQRMPLLTTDLGFNSWYLDSIPPNIKNSAIDYLGNFLEKLKNLDASNEVKQYYIPMGFDTSNFVSGDIPAMLYMVELRATRFVHPTLRKVARNIGEYIKNDLRIPVHFDEDSDRFDTKRGKHDIVIK